MKKMIAYNSKTLPFLFLVPSILVIICGYFAVSELNDYKILASIFFEIVNFSCSFGASFISGFKMKYSFFFGS
mgnify:CR=1 FL=1